MQLVEKAIKFALNLSQRGQAATKQEKAFGIRILRIARIKNLMA